MTPLSRTGNRSHPPWSWVRLCDRVRPLVHYILGFPFKFQQQRPNLWFKYPGKEGGNQTNRNFSLSLWPSWIFRSSKTTGPGLTTVSVIYENNSCLWSSSGGCLQGHTLRCSQHQGSACAEEPGIRVDGPNKRITSQSWSPGNGLLSSIHHHTGFSPESHIPGGGCVRLQKPHQAE